MKQTHSDFIETGAIVTKRHASTISARHSDYYHGEKIVRVPFRFDLNSLENHAMAALEFLRKSEFPGVLAQTVVAVDNGYIFPLIWTGERADQ